MSQVMKIRPQTSFPSTQNGAALIIALVILTAITVVGIANMQSATLEMKMVTSTLDRNRSFSAAEAALTAVEQRLSEEIRNESQLEAAICPDGSGANSCFNRECIGGRCFFGEFDAGSNFAECKVFTPPNSDGETGSQSASRPKPWEDRTLWQEAGNHQTVTVSMPQGNTTVDVTVKYMIEFQCFVRRDIGAPFVTEAEHLLSGLGGSGFSLQDVRTHQNNGLPYFQITVYVDSSDTGVSFGSGIAPVMLQSNYVYEI